MEQYKQTERVEGRKKNARIVGRKAEEEGLEEREKLQKTKKIKGLRQGIWEEGYQIK